MTFKHDKYKSDMIKKSQKVKLLTIYYSLQKWNFFLRSLCGIKQSPYALNPNY